MCDVIMEYRQPHRKYWREWALMGWNLLSTHRKNIKRLFFVTTTSRPTGCDQGKDFVFSAYNHLPLNAVKVYALTYFCYAVNSIHWQVSVLYLGVYLKYMRIGHDSQVLNVMWNVSVTGSHHNIKLEGALITWYACKIHICNSFLHVELFITWFLFLVCLKTSWMWSLELGT
jgi:hypothetical protein